MHHSDCAAVRLLHLRVSARQLSLPPIEEKDLSGEMRNQVEIPYLPSYRSIAPPCVGMSGVHGLQNFGSCGLPGCRLCPKLTLKMAGNKLFVVALTIV